MLRTAGLAGVGPVMVLVLASGGCVPLPSDPVQPPVGVREDDGVLSVIVRLCPGDEPLAAEVVSYESNPDMEPAWAARGYLGGASDIVGLDPEHWHEVEGAYESLDRFGVQIDMGDRFEGAGIRDDGTYRNLGPDEFRVSGEVMTADEFRQLVADEFPCPSPPG